MHNLLDVLTRALGKVWMVARSPLHFFFPKAVLLHYCSRNGEGLLTGRSPISRDTLLEVVRSRH